MKTNGLSMRSKKSDSKINVLDMKICPIRQKGDGGRC